LVSPSASSGASFLLLDARDVMSLLGSCMKRAGQPTRAPTLQPPSIHPHPTQPPHLRHVLRGHPGRGALLRPALLLQGEIFMYRQRIDRSIREEDSCSLACFPACLLSFRPKARRLGRMRANQLITQSSPHLRLSLLFLLQALPLGRRRHHRLRPRLRPQLRGLLRGAFFGGVVGV
jgi:hypothetical protein